MSDKFLDFFVGYGSYHNQIINKIIHFIFVPTIFFTAIGLLLHANLFTIVLGGYDINITHVMMGILTLVYLYVDLPSGVVSSVFYWTSVIYQNQLFVEAQKSQEASSFYFQWNLYLHIVSWILQFVGHGVFEGRKPALLDNLLQVFVAPDFVVIQWMFYLGYRNKEYIQAKKRIHNNINELNKKDQEKKAKSQ